MKITIGIPAHNEEKNIGKLLGLIIREKRSVPQPIEIIVVNDGSTDKTKDVVKSFEKDGVKLINKQQGGKVSAINEIIKNSKGDIIIVQDSDTSIKGGSYNLIIRCFKYKNIGMVAGKGIPTNKGKKFTTFVAKTFSEMHHLHSLRMVKEGKAPRIYGALYAFRKKIIKEPIPERIVADGEYIRSIIQNKWYKVFYEPRAIFFTLEADNLSELIKSRRRRISGHLLHKEITGSHVSSTKPSKSVSIVMDYLKFKNWRVNFLGFSMIILMEIFVRLLAYYDFKRKKIHFIYRY